MGLGSGPDRPTCLRRAGDHRWNRRDGETVRDHRSPPANGQIHRDPEATFRAWSEIWLDPDFRDWNIEDWLPNIHCPVLLIQALDDEYGTMAQLDAIERGVSGPVERLVLPDGGHSSHVSHPEEVTAEITRFVSQLGPGHGGTGR